MSRKKTIINFRTRMNNPADELVIKDEVVMTKRKAKSAEEL
jgi:hypothetical protein